MCYGEKRRHEWVVDKAEAILLIVGDVECHQLEDK